MDMTDNSVTIYLSHPNVPEMGYPVLTLYRDNIGNLIEGLQAAQSRLSPITDFVNSIRRIDEI